LLRSVAIIGGGPVGAVAALLLAQHGLQVTIINRPTNAKNKNGYKAGETLPPVANALLKQLGLYDLIQQGPHVHCPGNQSAFGSQQLVDFDFIFSSNGLGWHLDRAHFEQQLLDRAKESDVKIVHQKLKAIRFDSEKWQLQLQNDQQQNLTEQETTLTTDYLIDASGVARFLARQQNITIKHHDKLAARIAVFKTDSQQQDHRTLIEAQESGWWYSTSAPNNIRLVIFFSDFDLEAFQTCNNTSNFLNKVDNLQFIRHKLKQECSNYSVENILSFFTEPARSSQASQVQGKQWIAIGDAAASFDPLSSQGLWSGFQSANLAVQTIIGKVPRHNYSEWSCNIYNNYLVDKKRYYSMEQRWIESEFWQRRINQVLGR